MSVEEKEIELKVEEFLDRETHLGVRVRNLRLKNGHYLIYKIPRAEKLESGLYLPDIVRGKATKSLHVIMGFVVRSSEPYHPKKAEKTWVHVENPGDGMPGNERIKWKVKALPLSRAQVEAGNCVAYNSYNIGKVAVEGILEPLVIVREIDILAYFPVEMEPHVRAGHGVV